MAVSGSKGSLADHWSRFRSGPSQFWRTFTISIWDTLALRAWKAWQHRFSEKPGDFHQEQHLGHWSIRPTWSLKWKESLENKTSLPEKDSTKRELTLCNLRCKYFIRRIVKIGSWWSRRARNARLSISVNTNSFCPPSVPREGKSLWLKKKILDPPAFYWSLKGIFSFVI